jgi:DNA-binding transcriptional MerR regulator
MTDQIVLPEDQDQFKLNEVCKLANVQPYMLRFWGTEFSQLEAAKSGTGQRLYSKGQVELILEIRRLLFDEGLTIAGARKKISATDQWKETAKSPPAAEDDEPAEERPPEKKATKKKAAPPKTSSARRKSPKKKAAADKVDKETPPDVQPLLATLKDVRDEVEKIIEDLKAN